MILRVLTAVVALAVVLPILFLGGVPGAQVLCIAAACLGLWEYGGLRGSSTGNRVFAMVLAALPILAAGMQVVPPPEQEILTGFKHLLTPGDGRPRPILSPLGADYVLLALGAVFLAVPIAAVLRPSEIDRAPERIAATLFGVIYLGFTLSFCVMLRALPNGLLWICLGLAVIWLGDTGAYLGGRAFGKHKLHERVSPKKTWEGAIAGLLTSIAAALAARTVYGLLDLWEGPPLRAVDAVAVGLLAGLLGQVGDLAESLLKRAVGVKDSGTLFPGHGGMLDRIDALLFALPGVYFYAKFALAWFPPGT